jgi:DNA-binding NtrC family response regulator
VSVPSHDILIVSDDVDVQSALLAVSREQGWDTMSAVTGAEAMRLLEARTFRVAVMELSLPDFSSVDLLQWWKPGATEVVILASDPSDAQAVACLKLGAFDCLSKPLDHLERVAHGVRSAIEAARLKARLGSFGGEDGFASILGRDPQMLAVYELIRSVAPSDSTVLLLGESGTGKELAARAIHRCGNRKDKPFVVINCAAMPDTLFESELFGYARGAFTGAVGEKAGLFESAEGGTVFLDEIGEVPLATQVKLLRVLQEGEIKRLGEGASRHVDVRLVAATHKDLSRQVAEGAFREDLYYRLNVINIVMPALRERPDDVPLLATHFLERYSAKMKRPVMHLSMDALQVMQSYSWPGNVRELENVIERAVVLTRGNVIEAKNLPSKILGQAFYHSPADDADLSDLSYPDAKKRALNIFNRSYILNILEKSNGNITLASERAGLDRSNFKKIIRKYLPDEPLRKRSK